jgi:hypothetical protein
MLRKIIMVARNWGENKDMKRQEAFLLMDLLQIIVIFSASLITVSLQKDWTGLYILGLLPLVLADLKKDIRNSQGR